MTTPYQLVGVVTCHECMYTLSQQWYERSAWKGDQLSNGLDYYKRLYRNDWDSDPTCAKNNH
jgi:hypothetical protein